MGVNAKRTNAKKCLATRYAWLPWRDRPLPGDIYWRGAGQRYRVGTINFYRRGKVGAILWMVDSTTTAAASGRGKRWVRVFSAWKGTQRRRIPYLRDEVFVREEDFGDLVGRVDSVSGSELHQRRLTTRNLSYVVVFSSDRAPHWMEFRSGWAVRKTPWQRLVDAGKQRSG